MLEPAIAHKEELIALFSQVIYTEDFYLFSGYPHDTSLPNCDKNDAYWYRYAIMDGKNCIGYLSYYVDPVLDCVKNFGLYSFDRGNFIVGRDLFRKMEELANQFHRIEWCVIEGNPVIKHYDKFCKRHGGRKIELRDSTKDNAGRFRNSYTYEIVNADKGADHWRGDQ